MSDAEADRARRFRAAARELQTSQGLLAVEIARLLGTHRNSWQNILSGQRAVSEALTCSIEAHAELAR